MEEELKNSDETLQVGAGVIVEDGAFLITRRMDDTHQGGLWEFPGGKRHDDETIEDCVRREIREELDLDVEVGPPLKVVRYAYSFFTVELHFFRCTIRSGDPVAIGCQDFEWVTPDQLAQYEFPPANHPIINMLREGRGI